MSKAVFRIYGRFNGQSEATVTVDRANNLVTVRPLHFRKTYCLPLESIANNIILTCIKAEIREKKLLKRRKS